jgi:tetratricopeptide (TPR) repeat protein
MNASSIPDCAFHRWLLPLLLFGSCLAGGEGSWLDQPGFRFHYETLRALDAERVLQSLDDPSLSPEQRELLRAWAYYQKGEYVLAETHFSRIKPGAAGMGSFLAYRHGEMLQSARIMKDFQVVEFPHFSVRYQSGRDEVLVIFLEDILERSYEAYARLFGSHFKQKIIVEIMPDHTLFSYASALTREQIETTGTVALCVENRLAMISPRRVLTGYYWPDVLAHELVHYFLTHLSRDHAPLWFQEGVAKYLEARWENPEARALDRHLEASLARGIAANRWISLEEMHPSFAALPSAELAQQAYAQVASQVDFMVQRKGEEVIRALVLGLAQEPDLEKILLAQFAMPYASLESEWKEWAKGRGYRDLETMRVSGVKLLEEDGEVEALSSLSPEDAKTKRSLSLGDLLLERQRYHPAYLEYHKAMGLQRPVSRQLLLRLLECLQHLGRHQETLQLLGENVPDLDHDVTMLKAKARAFMGLDDINQADAVLTRALRINPFDPTIHHLQREIAERQGRTDEAQRRAQLIEILERPLLPREKESKS